MDQVNSVRTHYLKCHDNAASYKLTGRGKRWRERERRRGGGEGEEGEEREGGGGEREGKGREEGGEERDRIDQVVERSAKNA